MNELRLTLHSKSIDIACVTETHFNSNLYESEIAINGYKCFRQVRNFKLLSLFMVVQDIQDMFHQFYTAQR